MRRSRLVYILLLILIVLLLILLLTKSCCNCKQQTTTIVRHIPVDMSQIVLWRNPDSAKDSFKNYIQNNFPNSAVNPIHYCASCDSDLVMISGPDVMAYLQGQTSKGGSHSQNVPPMGGEG